MGLVSIQRQRAKVAVGEVVAKRRRSRNEGESKAARDYEIDGGSATRCRGAAESCETKYLYQRSYLANSN